MTPVAPSPAPSAPPAEPARALSAPPHPTRRSRAGRVLWALFLLVDVPLLLAAGVGLAARWLHPGPFWWAQLVAIALPYLAVPVALAAAVPLAGRRKGWLLAHLVALVLILWRLSPPERLRARPVPAAGDLVVMTFNVPTVGPSERALGEAMVAVVRAEGPTVLAMQDAWVTATEPGRPAHLDVQVRAVAERLPYRVEIPAQFGFNLGWRRNANEVPLLVREGVGSFEVIEQRALRLSGDDDTSVGLRTRFRWQGREGVLYNVHLRSFGERKPWRDDLRLLDPTTWLPYVRQYRSAYRFRARDVDRIADALARERLPVLLVGDFNDTPDTWTYRRLSRGLRDAFRVAGDGLGRTYHSRKPFVRIDYVMADPAWEIVAARVPDVRLSDHRPVVVRLRWREE